MSILLACLLGLCPTALAQHAIPLEPLESEDRPLFSLASPVGSIEFDDPEQPHPVIASLQEEVEGEPGGVSGFRFWLKTILDPEDVEIFSEWASRQSGEYRRLIRTFDRATDEQAIESLLDQTLALVKREKSSNR